MSDDISTSDVSAPPSDAPAPDSAPPPSPAAPDVPASSSDASDVTAPSSGDSRQSDRDGLLAVVQKVVETRPEKPAIPSEVDADTGKPEETSQDQAAATGIGDKTPPDATTQIADPTEADLKKLRPETRKRFETLLAQRNEVRQAFEAAQPELAEYRQLRGYLTEHQLAPEDVNMLLGVGATLRRGDYQGFLNGVAPYVMAAQEALGLRISPDLAQQVNEGLIDEGTAQELTRTRHRAAQAEARLQSAHQVAEANQQVQHTDQIRSAVDSWEENIRRTDPDYVHMSDAVKRYAQGLMQERGMPRNQHEAVALTQAAYDEAKAAFRRLQPAPRPTRSGPSSIHVATGTPNASPRTMKEAVVMALANARRAS